MKHGRIWWMNAEARVDDLADKTIQAAAWTLPIIKKLGDFAARPSGT
jgi:hypothetical protein